GRGLLVRRVSPKMGSLQMAPWRIKRAVMRPAGCRGNRDKGSFAETYRCVLFDGNCAGERHALVQRGAWRARRRYRAGGSGYSAANGGGIAAVSEGLLFAAAGGGWFADRRGGELAGRGFSEGRVRAGQRSTGEPAGRAASVAVRREGRARL